jgi:hypothetical protein
MNTEMMVVSHPYYAVTDESGQFEVTASGNLSYWHEGWEVLGAAAILRRFDRTESRAPPYSEPKTWKQSVSVSSNQPSAVTFVITSK